MFDLRDLYALPIAFSLTLWDAFPIFISIGLALVILARVILNDRAFSPAWRIRNVASVEGLAYLALFQPSLVPVLLIAAFAMVSIHVRFPTDTCLPASPLLAVKIRFGEILGPLLAACAAAAFIKIFAPSIPDGLFIQTMLALCSAILLPGGSGTAAIPAVAVYVHFGGFIPATAWIAGATARSVCLHFAETRRVQATPDGDVESPRRTE